MAGPVVTLIAAVGRNGVIGDGHDMPWHLPEDFAIFRATTMGHALIMGRATFDSIGRPLPGRRSIVITRQRGWSHEGVEVVHSLDEALALTTGDEEVFIGGGGQIYAQAMALADRLVISEVHLEPEGSVVFPPIDPSLWCEVERRSHDGFDRVIFERY